MGGTVACVMRPHGSGRSRLEHVEVPFGVEPVLPFLVQDGLQAPAYREALRLFKAGPGCGFAA